MKSQSNISFQRIHSLLLKLISLQFVYKAYASALLTHIKEYAPALLLNLRKRCSQLLSAVASERSESVTCQTLGMNTTQNILTITYITFNQRNMMLAVNKADKSVCLEISVFCRHIHHCGAFNKFVVTFPVFLKSMNSNKLYIKTLRKF